MIKITYQELQSFLDSFKTNPDYYKTVEDLSTTAETPPRVLVTNSTKMFSGDDFCKNCRDYSGINLHSSVDGLNYFYNTDQHFNLALIEFKFVCNGIFAKGIGRLKKKDSDLRKLKQQNIKLRLKIKALETVFSVLPHFIEKYDTTGNKDIIIEQLINSPKIFIFVTDYVNKTRGHRDIKGDYFDLDRLSPYPFGKIRTSTVKSFEIFINNI
ncbi:hypothetical protein DSECCO2_454150 [anaerobic digester metagenome]